MHVSNVCRVRDQVLLDFLADKPAGKHVVPPCVLAPRQVRITEPEKIGTLACTLKFHRESLIPVLTRETATKLVNDGVAVWEPQSALIYTLEDYLVDEDVLANEEEFNKATLDGSPTVFVAVIGEGRSTLAVCRNIVSKCQKPERLDSDAKGAVEAARVILVED